MDTIEKVYCTGHDNNDALVAALASKNNCDPMAMAAMMNQNDYMNNPFAYLIWMIFAMRMWNNQDGNQGNAIQSQLDAMRSQIAGNQNSSLVMDAIRGNANAITQLASNLNCDFNALNNAICCVRSGIQEVAGNVNFSAERVINAINLGDANLTSALQNCCCQTQQNIIKIGYENQLGQKDIVNQMQTGFSQTNSGLERAASNLGFQMSQIACDLKTNANANTQRIVIRHSDDDNQNSKYVANLQKNEDGSYSASVGVVKEDGYNDYVSKHGLHFTKALQEYASKQMVNSNNQEHTWTSEQVQNVCNVLNLKIPNTSTIEDVTYTANMAYADFYPELLNEHQCIKYAAAVANDKDGYTGIQFCRWVADVVGKKENIDWDKFK